MSDNATGASAPANDADLRAAMQAAMSGAQSSAASTGATTGAASSAGAPDSPDALKAEVEKWKALSRQNEATAKSNAAAAKRLAEIEAANKTAEQKAQEAAETAAREAAAAKAELARFKVAAEKGVPAELLTGTTEEELKASADKLLAFVGKSKPTPDLGQGNRGPAGAADPNAWLRNMARRQNF